MKFRRWKKGAYWRFRRKVDLCFRRRRFSTRDGRENVAYRLRRTGQRKERSSRVCAKYWVRELDTTRWASAVGIIGRHETKGFDAALVNQPPVVLYDSRRRDLIRLRHRPIITLILRCATFWSNGPACHAHVYKTVSHWRFSFRSGDQKNGCPHLKMATLGGCEWARTRFLVYRDGDIYFEGEPEEIANSEDPYLKRFLV